MSFNICRLGGEECDACGVKDEQPMIQISAKTKYEKNYVFIHRHCLEKKLAAYDKAQAKSVAA